MGVGPGGQRRLAAPDSDRITRTEPVRSGQWAEFGDISLAKAPPLSAMGTAP